MHIYIGGNGWGMTIGRLFSRRIYGIDIWFCGENVDFNKTWTWWRV
jgi:hypothetical protein